MNRRNFIKNMGLSMAAIGFSCCGSMTPLSNNPNILMIVTDDQGYADLECTGYNSIVKTPGMDKLAKRGVRFNQAYATSPICSPSRMSLITGCYPQRFGTYWYGGKGIHREKYKTLPELLRNEGYQCGYVGKVHYGSPNYDSGTEVRNFPLNHGFNYFFGFTSARKHYLHHKQQYVEKLEREKKAYGSSEEWFASLRQGPLWHNKRKVNVDGFTTEMFGEEAREFISNNKKQPFYLQLSFNAVHNFTHQLPEDYLEKHNLNGIEDWDPKQEKYMDWYKRGRKPFNKEGRELYLGQLEYLDKEIAKVYRHLEQENLVENTIVILMSDNGGSTQIYCDNSPLRGGKYTLFEGGIRVPLIISYPGKYRQNQVDTDNIVSGMDLLPTIYKEITGKEYSQCDGIDIGPILRSNRKRLQNRFLVWDTQNQMAVRQGNWKWLRIKDTTDHEREGLTVKEGDYLFNLSEDIGEQKNLITQEKCKYERLMRRYNGWKKEIKKDSKKTI